MRRAGLALTAAVLVAAAPPPPPPSAPAAPPINLTAPAVGEQKVVIVQSERHAAAGAGHTVTVQRKGKTYVFTTDRELTPAELEARIAKVDAEVAGLPPLPATPAGQQTVVIRRSDKPQR